MVKAARPNQDAALDLPAIGPETVAAARKAGLAGIALEAGRGLILERDRTLAEADAAGLFVYGRSPGLSSPAGSSAPAPPAPPPAPA